MLRFLVFAALCSVTTPVLAACGDSGTIQCRREFESINAVVWAGDGFIVAGQTKNAVQSGLAILRLGANGEAKSNIIPLRWPNTGLPTGGQMTAEVRKLIALPNRTIAVVAVIHSGQDIGWVTLVDANGSVVWSKTFPAAPASVVLHSGQYDARDNRLIIVGRRTLGADDGRRCQNWSQSLVITLRASDGEQIVPVLTNGDQGKTPNSRQALYDITPGDRPGTFAVAGFMSSANPVVTDRCKDNMFAATLVPDRDKWKFATQGRVGSKDGNEVAFSIRAAGGGEYLLAGYVADSPTAAPAAQAYRVKLTPFSVLPPPLLAPYPADGSDKTGGDRYRVIVPLGDTERFLLAGSVSTSRQALNLGMWQIVSRDLSKVEAPSILTDGGTDILDAAISPQGSVLSVGRWTDETNHLLKIGFTSVIGGQPTDEYLVASADRAPNSRLPDLMSIRSADGVYRVPAAAMDAGARYFARDLAAEARIDLTFSVSALQSLKVSVLTGSGDLDLVLSDKAKRPLSFSNYRRSNTQLLIQALPPGDYTISIIAHTKVPACEIQLARSREIGASAINELAKLSEEERVALAKTLASAGYNEAPEPTIALGGETVRALLAAQERAQGPIGPRGIGKVVARTLGEP